MFYFYFIMLFVICILLLLVVLVVVLSKRAVHQQIDNWLQIYETHYSTHSDKSIAGTCSTVNYAQYDDGS